MVSQYSLISRNHQIAILFQQELLVDPRKVELDQAWTLHVESMNMEMT